MESQKLTVKLDTSEVVAGIRALCAPLAEIVQESARGQEKYGGEANDDSYTPFRWTQLIQDELHAARRASIHGAVSTKDDVRERMKRVAGLALSAMLAFDRATKRANEEHDAFIAALDAMPIPAEGGCEDEGCPEYGTAHVHGDGSGVQLPDFDPAAVVDRALEGVQGPTFTDAEGDVP